MMMMMRTLMRTCLVRSGEKPCVEGGRLQTLEWCEIPECWRWDGASHSSLRSVWFPIWHQEKVGGGPSSFSGCLKGRAAHVDGPRRASTNRWFFFGGFVGSTTWGKGVKNRQSSSNWGPNACGLTTIRTRLNPHWKDFCFPWKVSVLFILSIFVWVWKEGIISPVWFHIYLTIFSLGGRIATGDLFGLYTISHSVSTWSNMGCSVPHMTVTPGATKDSDFGGWAWLPGVFFFLGWGWIGSFHQEFEVPKMEVRKNLGYSYSYFGSSVGSVRSCVCFFFFPMFLFPSGKKLTKLNYVTHIFLSKITVKGVCGWYADSPGGEGIRFPQHQGEKLQKGWFSTTWNQGQVLFCCFKVIGMLIPPQWWSQHWVFER